MASNGTFSQCVPPVLLPAAWEECDCSCSILDGICCRAQYRAVQEAALGIAFITAAQLTAERAGRVDTVGSRIFLGFRLRCQLAIPEEEADGEEGFIFLLATTVQANLIWHS